MGERSPSATRRRRLSGASLAAALACAACSASAVRNDAHAVRSPATFGSDRFATVDGHNLHYVESGGGPPVLLIPGAFSTYRVWNAMAPILAEHHRVLALDYVGAGDSDKPVDGFGYTVAEQADVVAGLIRELELNAPRLVGVSYGSAIALNVAARYPDLPASVACIEGGMLIAPDVLKYSHWYFAFDVPILGDFTMSLLRTGWFDRTCSRTIMGGAWEHLSPDEQNAIVAIQSSFVETATRASMYGIYRSITGAIDFTEEMGNARVPILYLSGECSKYREIAEANIAWFHDHAANVEVVRMKDGIHDLELQFPKEVARLVMDFWNAAPLH